MKAEVNNAVMLLTRTYPATFSRKTRPPLKVGIGAELRNLHPDLNPRTLQAALASWTHHPRYLQNLVDAKPRVGLDGQKLGERPTDAHQIHALIEWVHQIIRESDRHHRRNRLKAEAHPKVEET